MMLAAAMTCAAMLMNMAPVALPDVIVTDAATIASVTTARGKGADALFAGGTIIISPNPRFSLVVHEMCHAVQFQNGLPITTPAAESQCGWVERKADNFCEDPS